VECSAISACVTAAVGSPATTAAGSLETVGASFAPCWLAQDPPLLSWVSLSLNEGW
jgi:hypothetical protein